MYGDLYTHIQTIDNRLLRSTTRHV